MTRTFRGATRLLLSFLLLLCSFAVLAQSLPRTTGEQKTAVILVNFQDDTSQPISPAAAHTLVFGTVSDFYWEASYGRTLLSGDTYGWYTIPVSKAGCDRDLIALEADRAATAAGVALGNYQRIVYLFPQNGCSASGYNSGAGSVPTRTWIKGNNYSAYVIAHELGHNFGLLHSQSLDCGAAVLGSGCTTQSYGDPADTMGYGAIPHFNAFQKQLLGWIGGSGQPGLATVTASGRYRIEPLAAAGTGVKALRIARGTDPTTGRTRYYYLEYRQPVGFDTVLGGIGNLTAGVLVHSGVEGDGFSSYLLDMTPDSVPGSSYSDAEDGALAPGRRYVDSAAGVSFEVVAVDATGATVDVTLGASSSPPPADPLPLTGSIGTSKTSYVRGETVAMSMLVKRDGVPVAGAAVRFTVASPSGTTSTYNATTGSDGYARASFKLGKAKSLIGTWSVQGEASKDGATVVASTGFSVR